MKSEVFAIQFKFSSNIQVQLLAIAAPAERSAAATSAFFIGQNAPLIDIASNDSTQTQLDELAKSSDDRVTCDERLVIRVDSRKQKQVVCVKGEQITFDSTVAIRRTAMRSFRLNTTLDLILIWITNCDS